MNPRHDRGAGADSIGDAMGEREGPARSDRVDEGAAYAASAAAPSAPPSSSEVADGPEVDFGSPFVPTMPDDAMLAMGSETADPAAAMTAAASVPVRTVKGKATPREQSTVPSAPNPLCTDDGRVVSVVHLVAELAPFARTGGLGEAVKSLAEFQCASGIPTAIIMPLYRQVHAVAPNLEPVGDPFLVQLGPTQELARLMQIAPDRRARSRKEPRVYFLDHPHFFDRPGLYGANGYDYPDNPRRYAFFSLAALLALPRIAPNAPLVMHAHDWHTALASVYLRTFFMGDDYYRQVRTVLSVHNAGFQGQYPARTMADVGLPWELYNYRQLEWYEKMNFLKGGLSFSDMVTTVSPTHAHELRTPFGGFGLHDTFIGLRDRFVGIVNGIDQRVWDPATDKQITAHYTAETLDVKRKCKASLQRAFGLKQRANIPIFAMSARLTYQKGLDLILGYNDYFALDGQFLFLGAGDPRYEAELRELAGRAPGRIACEFNFTERLEHRLMAGADMCLMPSQYEPCGLTQMRAQRYGTIPVARRVGGLADTIEDGVTGFLFDGYTSEEFMHAAVRALDHYHDPAAWREMMKEAMSRDFGWERSESRYRDVYRKALGVGATV
jgi:starch synthase